VDQHWNLISSSFLLPPPPQQQQEYIANRHLPGHDTIPELDFEKAAINLEGFSGREISKLVLSLLNGVYGSSSGSMTRQLFDRVVRQKLQEHQEKERISMIG